MKRLFLLLPLLMTAACDDPIALTLDLVAGTYVATEFEADGDDILAAGGTLSMTLASDGSVTGELDLPSGAGGPFTADLAGSFSVSGQNVGFSQSADTFIRDATWTWDDGRLSGVWSNSSSTVSVEMQRQ